MKYKLFMFHLWMTALFFVLLGLISGWKEYDKVDAMIAGIILAVDSIMAILFLGFFLKEYIEKKFWRED